MKNIKARFQLLDEFVKEYNMILNSRIDKRSKIEANCTLGFEMSEVREKENKKIGQIGIIYNLNLLKENEEIGKIHLKIQGLFEGDKELEKEEFEKMLKYNGGSTLSQIARAYIISNTALSGMPTITLPMINFMEFFNNATVEKNSIDENKGE